MIPWDLTMQRVIIKILLYGGIPEGGALWQILLEVGAVENRKILSNLIFNL
jgi:hypothetical protein